MDKDKQIRKQVACEEKAFHTVIRLLEDDISEEYLSDAGQLLSNCHYEDVVDERSISKQCGYPLCCQRLGKIPKHRYHISSKSNMVIDLTERKKFCSTVCLKASQYFAAQISASPIWMKKHEPMVEFKFLKVKNKTGLIGDKVALSLPCTDLKRELDDLSKLDAADVEESNNTVSSSYLVGDVVQRISALSMTDVADIYGDKSNTHETTLRSSDEGHESKNGKGQSFTNEVSKEDATGNMDKKVEDCRENECKQAEANEVERKDLKIDCSKVKGQLAGETKEDYVMRLLSGKKKLLGSFIDIHQSERAGNCNLTGMDEAKGGVDSDDEDGGDNIVSRGGCDTRTKVERKTCESVRKVVTPLSTVSEVIEQWTTRSTFQYLGVRSDSSRKDFLKTELEAKDIELKIKDFYKGSKRTTVSTIMQEQRPIVDSHDQMLIRKKIVLERIDRILLEILKPLKLTVQDVSKPLRELVFTFSLTSKNITFKPEIWRLIAIILLKLLALKFKAIDDSFREETGTRYIKSILSVINQTVEELDTVVHWLSLT